MGKQSQIISVSFRLWAQMRVDAGRSLITIDLPAGSSVGEALEILYREHAELVPHRATARAAVRTEYVGEEHPLARGDEISLIPPVQGG